jgi:hypothetical protein
MRSELYAVDAAGARRDLPALADGVPDPYNPSKDDSEVKQSFRAGRRNSQALRARSGQRNVRRNARCHLPRVLR